MEIQEQYLMYQLAYKLVKEEQYEMLHINPKLNEIWLEKQSRQSSKLIRIVQRGFDWKNHLKKDIASVFKRIKLMKNHFIGKEIDISNIYITEHEPVDSWYELKQPMVMKDKKPVKMKVFYITDENRYDEEQRLLKQLDIGVVLDEDFPPEMVQKTTVKQYKHILANFLKEKNEQIKHIFSYGKARITFALVFLNLIIFFMLELNGGSTDIDTLVKYGAKYNPAIVSGEWWRIISSMFLHIGALHLFMNMLAIYYLGTAVERIYGSSRFIIIYFISGIIGSLTSFAFNTHIAAGASGALFGLFGALLYFGVIYKQLFYQTMGKSIIFILLINLVFGFLIPQIDMGAHVGGLIGGFIAAAIASLPYQKHSVKLHKLLGFISFLIIIVLLVGYGIIMHDIS